MITPPGEPTPNNPLASWCLKLLRFCVAARLLPGVGYKLKTTSVGTFLEIEPAKGGGTSGVTYKGTFDQTKSYKKDEVVRVKSGASQGVFICITDNPIDQQSGFCIAPAWPENSYWDMFAFGPKVLNVCRSNADAAIYAQASEPF